MTNFVGRLGVTLGLDSAEFSRGIDGAAKKLDQFADSAATYGKVAAAALIAAGAAALKYADDIADAAAANDVAISSILQLSNALAANGGKADDASKLFSKFTSEIDKAAQGSFETQKILGSLGVSFKDLGTLDIDILFRKTVEGLAGMDDTLTRNAKAFELFGKAAKGIDFVGLNQEMQATNTVTDQQAKAIKDAADTYDILAKAARDFSIVLAVELGPPLKSTLDYIKNIGGETSVMGNVFKTVFQTMAVLGANVAFVFEAIADEVAQTLTNARLLATLDFSGAKASNQEYWAKWEKRRAELDAFEKRIMGTSPTGGGRMTGEVDGDPRRTDRPVAGDKAGAPLRLTVPGVDKKAEAERKRVFDNWARGYLATQAEIAEGQKLIDEQAEDYRKKDETFLEKRKKQNDEGRRQEAADIEEAQRLINEQASEYQRKESDFRERRRQERLQALKQEADEIEEGRRLITQQADDYQKANAAIVERHALDAESIRRQKVMMQLTDEGRYMQASEFQLAQDKLSLEYKYDDLRRDISNNEKLTATDKEAALQRLLKLQEQDLDVAKQRYEITKRSETGTFGQGFSDAMAMAAKNATTTFQAGQQSFDIMISSMNNALTQFVRTGKLSFKDLAKSMIADMLAIQLRAQMTGILKSMFPGGAGTSMSQFQYASISGYADGGQPPVGKASIVGERGPELFVPNTAGTIIPNHQLGSMGSTTNVTNNYINAIDVKSFEDRLLGSSNTIWAANQYANKNLSTNFGRT